MSDFPELKPCPFCGGEATSGVAWTEKGCNHVILLAQIGCEKCKVWRAVKFQGTDSVLVHFERYTEAFEKAIAEWNRRANDG